MNLDKLLQRIERHALKTSLYACISENLLELTSDEKKLAANYYAKEAKRFIDIEDIYTEEKLVKKYFRNNSELDSNSKKLILLNQEEKDYLIIASLYSVLPLNSNDNLKENEFNVIVEILKELNIKPINLSYKRLYELQEFKKADVLIEDIKNLFLLLIKQYNTVADSANATLKLIYTISSMVEEKPGVRKFSILGAFETNIKEKRIGYTEIDRLSMK